MTDTLTGLPGQDVDPSAPRPAPAAAGAPPGEAVSPASLEDADPAPSGQATVEVGRARRRTGGLSGMVLSELQELAGELGIPGTARMRKSDLIAAIPAQQAGGGQVALEMTAPAVDQTSGTQTSGTQTSPTHPPRTQP